MPSRRPSKLDSQIAKDLTSLGFTIREGYGLTETAPVIAFSPLIRPKTGSVGPPLKNVELQILNPSEKGIGEVVVRGPNVMKQYDNAPAETAEAIRDGWFHTGDLGYLDSDGYLFLTGRIKELIVTPGGKNILPEELEGEYERSPAIAELCIIGRRQNGSRTHQFEFTFDALHFQVTLKRLRLGQLGGAFTLQVLLRLLESELLLGVESQLDSPSFNQRLTGIYR